MLVKQTTYIHLNKGSPYKHSHTHTHLYGIYLLKSLVDNFSNILPILCSPAAKQQQKAMFGTFIKKR